jgi:hypothetical protein
MDSGAAALPPRRRRLFPGKDFQQILSSDMSGPRPAGARPPMPQ